MDSIKSYGKVDEQAFRRKSRKSLLILIVSSVVLVAVIIGAVVGTLIHKRNSDSGEVPSSPTTPAASMKAVCNVTQYPDSCFKSISALEASSATTDPEEILKLSLHVALNELEKLSSLPGRLMSKINDVQAKQALIVCQSVFEDAVDRLNDSISSMAVNDVEKFLSPSKISDLRTWLSSAITDQDTCLDALQALNSTTATTLYKELSVSINKSTKFASNSLAIVTKTWGFLFNYNIPIHLRLLGFSDSGGFPGWVTSADRSLLQEVNPTPDVTVAQDGSGDVKTIKEAVAKVAKKKETRFVIYVKTGTYLENVILDKSLWNVMFYGDGKTKTIVSGSLNFVDGTPTFSTATFAAVGKRFIAKDMAFRNTAGPEKQQAVAFRSGSDQSVFYRCSFEAFQDTLYAHSNRQFYRECDITGTIDFIFGNAAAVLQKCNIRPRQPMRKQYVTITAQGKTDPNQNTGISIQKCSMTPLDTLTVAAYLGRPWKDYSTTIVMQTNIGSFLHPSGWISWTPGVEPPKSIFYAEYQNTGPGSSVDKRVKWAGYKSNITAKQASKFTVESFIQGNDWLPATNVAFDSSL